MKPVNRKYLPIYALIISAALFAGCASGPQAIKDARGVIKQASENLHSAKSVSTKIVVGMETMGVKIVILDCVNTSSGNLTYSVGEVMDGNKGLMKTRFEGYLDGNNAVLLDPASQEWARPLPGQSEMTSFFRIAPETLTAILDLNQDFSFSPEEKIQDVAYQVIEVPVKAEVLNKALGKMQNMGGSFDKISVKMWVEKNTCLLYKVILSLEATMKRGGPGRAEAEGIGMKVKMEMNYSDYNKGAPIVIPPEAKKLLEAPAGADNPPVRFSAGYKPDAAQAGAISKTAAALASLKIPDLYNKYVDLGTVEVLDYDALLERLKDIRVIYVAESHTNPAHHKIQDDILRGIARKNPKAILAMEFLYRSKQPVCDDYIAGKITEPEFDAAVREGFSNDWYEKYYIGLVRYAKTNGLKLLGLNVEKAIKSKLADEGWDKLTPGEQKLIARDIDTSNKAHREFVMKSFEPMKKMARAFDEDRMYLLQCIWDETFGEAIANCLKSANDQACQIVVVAGSGHIKYKFNIPERSYKRYPASYKTLIPVGVDENTAGKEATLREALSSGVGDFIYFAPPVDGE
ncbi:MAG: ChaN family lipoprotein [Planctomycetes bacterium]|nr:ChaN family lipoprotein [Planctomycetota bacterium]